MATLDSHGKAPPSPWMERFAPLVPADSTVVDVACGSGRHSELFLGCGCHVTAIDRDVSRLQPRSGLEIIEANLEDSKVLPTADRRFDAVVVANYLYRPLLPALVDAVAPQGLLLYETFAVGNERFGRPSNPDYLLKPGELLEAVRGQLRVLAYEDVTVEQPQPAAVQRIAAHREPA